MDVMLVFCRVLMVLLAVGLVGSLVFLWSMGAFTGAWVGVSLIGTFLLLTVMGFFLWLAFGDWA